jgi:hypothetical protein
MRKKAARRRIEVNLEELDRIIDHGTRSPLSESDGQKIKAALHAMADRLTPKRSVRFRQACVSAVFPLRTCKNYGAESIEVFISHCDRCGRSLQGKSGGGK